MAQNEQATPNLLSSTSPKFYPAIAIEQNDCAITAHITNTILQTEVIDRMWQVIQFKHQTAPQIASFAWAVITHKDRSGLMDYEQAAIVHPKVGLGEQKQPSSACLLDCGPVSCIRQASSAVNEMPQLGISTQFVKKSEKAKSLLAPIFGKNNKATHSEMSPGSYPRKISHKVLFHQQKQFSSLPVSSRASLPVINYLSLPPIKQSSGVLSRKRMVSGNLEHQANRLQSEASSEYKLDGISENRGRSLGQKNQAKSIKKIKNMPPSSNTSVPLIFPHMDSGDSEGDADKYIHHLRMLKQAERQKQATPREEEITGTEEENMKNSKRSRQAVKNEAPPPASGKFIDEQQQQLPAKTRLRKKNKQNIMTYQQCISIHTHEPVASMKAAIQQCVEYGKDKRSSVVFKLPALTNSSQSLPKMDAITNKEIPQGGLLSFGQISKRSRQNSIRAKADKQNNGAKTAKRSDYQSTAFLAQTNQKNNLRRSSKTIFKQMPIENLMHSYHQNTIDAHLVSIRPKSPKHVNQECQVCTSLCHSKAASVGLACSN